jgi:hypothetical protein
VNGTAEVKMTARVPVKLHARVTDLAQTHKTTIGNMAVFGLERLVDELNRDPKIGARITKDPRRKKTK